MNSSLESTAKQSSTYQNFTPNNAIDGDLEDYAQTKMESGTFTFGMFKVKCIWCAHLIFATPKGAWFELDLEESATMNELIIYTTKEGLEHMSYASITLFDIGDVIVGKYQLGDVSDLDSPEVRIHGSDFFNPNPTLVGGFVIHDANNEEECQYAREQLSFDPDHQVRTVSSSAATQL